MWLQQLHREVDPPHHLLRMQASDDCCRHASVKEGKHGSQLLVGNMRTRALLRVISLPRVPGTLAEAAGWCWEPTVSQGSCIAIGFGRHLDMGLDLAFLGGFDDEDDLGGPLLEGVLLIDTASGQCSRLDLPYQEPAVAASSACVVGWSNAGLLLLCQADARGVLVAAAYNAKGQLVNSTKLPKQSTGTHPGTRRALHVGLRALCFAAEHLGFGGHGLEHEQGRCAPLSLR